LANIQALKAVLIYFKAVFGLKINFHKIVMVGVNISDSWLHDVALVLNCKHGCVPFLYLGLPIDGDPRRSHFLYLLLDQIEKRLSRWKSLKNLGKYPRLNGMFCA